MSLAIDRAVGCKRKEYTSQLQSDAPTALRLFTAAVKGAAVKGAAVKGAAVKGAAVKGAAVKAQRSKAQW